MSIKVLTKIAFKLTTQTCCLNCDTVDVLTVMHSQARAHSLLVSDSIPANNLHNCTDCCAEKQASAAWAQRGAGALDQLVYHSENV